MAVGSVAEGVFACADSAAALEGGEQGALIRAEPVATPTLPVNAYCRIGKRGFDVLFSMLVLMGLSWFYALLALLVKLDSPGPVLFRQRRVGLNGQIFDCLKFRTMRHEPLAQFCQAQKDDPRVTRIGRFLRKTNLDELPQFMNVLRGEMSVVGPRPHVPELDGAYQGLVPGYANRTRVRPGITGLAQVSGCRGETRRVRDMRKRVRMDLFYTRNAGLLFDLKIIIETVRSTLLGDQRAY